MTSPDLLTLPGTLSRAADAFGGLQALVFGDRRATYAELYDLVRAEASALLDLGVGHGQQVGVLMQNCWDYVVLYYALNHIGARAVLLNARYRADDLAFVIPHARLQWLFIGGQARDFCDYRALLGEAFGQPLTLETIRAAAPELMQVIEIGDDRPGPFASHAIASRPATAEEALRADDAAASVAPNDVGVLMFSSGTTSRPKACMLTHRSLTLTGAATAERFELTPADRVFDPLPLFHMSTILPLAACRTSGACFIGMDRFDGDAALPVLIAERPTVNYIAFPAIASAITDHPDFAKWDQSDLRISHIVGPPDLLRRYAGLFPGATPLNSYGLTEATGVPCYSRLDDDRENLFTTNGFVIDGMEVAIGDAEGGHLPAGEPGEILLRGFALFAGYYGDPEATATAVDGDGWLHTGDRGRIGLGGRLIYEGRIKDMLKVGGENVAAIEIESFLMSHPGVKMAQVIGVPDERLMEVAAAFVERAAGCEVSELDLVRHCKGRIASFKIPRYFRFVEEWPMSATKVQKFALREAFHPTGKIDVKAV